MQNRRSIILINPRFQVLFCLYVCSWILALSSFYPIIVYNLFGQLLQCNVQFNAPSAAQSAIQNARTQIIVLLFVMELLFVGVVFLISLFISHRIAGPLYKLSTFFAKAAEGDYKSVLSFREKDHFIDLAHDYNRMISGIRDRDERKNSLLEKAAQALEGQNSDLASELRASIEPTTTKATISS